MEKLTEEKRKLFARNNITIMSMTKNELRQHFIEVFDKLKKYEDGELPEEDFAEWQTILDMPESKTIICTACKYKFWFMKRGQLNMDKMLYCPHCGKRIKQAQTKEKAK